jgi:hypothetical protein
MVIHNKRYNALKDKFIRKVLQEFRMSEMDVIRIFEIYEEFEKEWSDTYGW